MSVLSTGVASRDMAGAIRLVIGSRVAHAFNIERTRDPAPQFLDGRVHRKPCSRRAFIAAVTEGKYKKKKAFRSCSFYMFFRGLCGGPFLFTGDSTLSLR